MRVLFHIVLLASLTCSALCRRGDKKDADAVPDAVAYARSYPFDAGLIAQDLAEVAASPHALGSARQIEVAVFVEKRALAVGMVVERSAFTAHVPNPVLLETPSSPADSTLDRAGINLWAFPFKKEDASCIVLVGSHYDTKEVAGTGYRGANDSGSSSVALVALAGAIKEYHARHPLRCQVALVWFDGEEAALPNWTDGETIHPAKIKDNTYGSRYEAGRLVACGKGQCLPKELGGHGVAALVLLDMIGSPDITLTADSHSTPSLDLLVRDIDKQLYPQHTLFLTAAHPVEDDHIPFKEKGIAVIDLIDFAHLNYWHQAGDDAATVSVPSIVTVSRLALATILSLATTGDGGP